MAVAVSLCMTACAKSSKDSKDMNSKTKTLVTYFSATGTTERVAKQIASVLGADIYEIKPVKEYTSADLNWTDKSSRSSIEMADEKSRPEIVEDLKNLENYDTIYIGYPIWWDLAPREINTFIEKYDLSGKTAVIPFATSGGSTISNSAAQLKKSYPNLKWQKGKLLNSADEDDIRNW